MSFFERLLQGPQERAAQAHLDDIQAVGGVATRKEAEALSDGVWAARDRDQAAHRGDDEREAGA